MKQKGLTLVEIIITLGLMSIVGGLIVVIITNSTGLSLKESSKVDMGLQLNDSLSIIRKNVKVAQSVEDIYTIGEKTYQSDEDEVVLKVSSIDEGNNIIDNTFDYFIFSKENNNLVFKTYPDDLSFRNENNQILSTNLENLVFKYLDLGSPPQETAAKDAKRVLVTMSVKKKTGNDSALNIATSGASLRNFKDSEE